MWTLNETLASQSVLFLESFCYSNRETIKKEKCVEKITFIRIQKTILWFLSSFYYYMYILYIDSGIYDSLRRIKINIYSLCELRSRDYWYIHDCRFDDWVEQIYFIHYVTVMIWYKQFIQFVIISKSIFDVWRIVHHDSMYLCAFHNFILIEWIGVKKIVSLKRYSKKTKFRFPGSHFYEVTIHEESFGFQ